MPPPKPKPVPKSAPPPKPVLPQGVLVVVDKSTFTLSLFRNGHKEETFSAGLGKPGEQTPTGKFRVISREVDPVYHPGGKKPPVPGGSPENPLGPRWLGLDVGHSEPDSIGIHGTTKGAGVGQPQTEGCVQLKNEIILKVFDQVPLGTPVWIGTTAELRNWGV
ncbi:putative L,D-transpeptidase YkuD [Peptococcaceae bacterium CEB3]|nr:putative L,D-transpeptidase YkuD [Peptococcaceae bacterium CEB3]